MSPTHALGDRRTDRWRCRRGDPGGCVIRLARQLRVSLESGALSDLGDVDLGYGRPWPAEVAAQIVLADHVNLTDLDTNGTVVPPDRWSRLHVDLARLMVHVADARRDPRLGASAARRRH